MNNREIVTYTGRMFDFLNPKIDSIWIEDIAHSLACTNRYGGHTSEPYSVAEHCVRMAYPEYKLPGDPLVNLLHDAPEAYVGDIPSPQKGYLCWFEFIPLTDGETFTLFRNHEKVILDIIYTGLEIPQPVPITEAETKRADNIMMATEVRDLLPPQAYGIFQELGWIPDGIEPLLGKIEPWPWQVAEERFLNRYKELTN